jgi:hypothetical protein
VIGLTRASNSFARTIRLPSKSCRREQSLHGMVSAVLGAALMSQASFDSQYVLSTDAGLAQDIADSSVVHKFKDYRLLKLALGID